MTCEVEEVCLRHGTFCRYRSVVDMVKSWHQEKQHYSFPHPHECNPRCPSKCSSSVCSHYTQVSATAPCTPCSPQHPAASWGTAHSALGHCSTRAASSPFPSSSWDPRPNPGSCLRRIWQQGWQQAACLPEGCGQPAAMPSHPWPLAPAGTWLLAWRSQGLAAHWRAAGTFWAVGWEVFILSVFLCFGLFLLITLLTPQRWWREKKSPFVLLPSMNPLLCDEVAL